MEKSKLKSLIESGLVDREDGWSITMNKLQSLIESGLVDREDGTIFDTRTNLLWQQSSSNKTYTWEEAISYCNSLTLAGYANWRLPTIEELTTLINTRYIPTIDPIFECESYWYWSSSTFVTSLTNAWYISFSSGHMCYYVRTYGCCVRAVRGVQP